jgi:hypothetical protein
MKKKRLVPDEHGSTRIINFSSVLSIVSGEKWSGAVLCLLGKNTM